MKVRYIIQTALLTTLILFFAPSRSHATVSFHWSFDQTQYVVGPTDQFSIGATLFNDASSSGPLVFGAFSVGAFFGSPQWPYRFSFGPNPDWPVDPWLQFTDGDVGKTLTLAPGQGFHFVWGVMTPRNGYASVGTYGPPWAAELGIGGI